MNAVDAVATGPLGWAGATDAGVGGAETGPAGGPDIAAPTGVDSGAGGAGAVAV
ncbi:hypothetical protein ACWENR_02640 [Micromonospora sp. NPDC004336]